nr:reverse transcriptase domain-containing protein [Tanacetum cinerariifolium]
MDAPPSPNHVFNLPEVEFEEDPQEEPEEEFEENPKEDPKEELEVEAEDDVPHPATSSVGSPITLPPLSESSSDTEDVDPIIADETLEMPPISSTYEDLGDDMQFRNLVEHRVTKLEDKDQEKAEEMEKMSKHLGILETNYSLGALDARPDIGDDGPASFGESKPPKTPGSPSSSQIMPPKMMKRKAVKKMVKKRIAEAIEGYEKTRVKPGNASGSGVTNTGGSVNVQEAYNNRFHELAFMCLDLVQNKKKKIERYMKGFPERIKGNITSSRPTTLHKAINLARELVEQAVHGKAARVNESNKKKWEEHQKNHPNNKNNPNCNTPKLARSGILGSGRATSWINNTRYILNDQKVV